MKPTNLALLAVALLALLAPATLAADRAGTTLAALPAFDMMDIVYDRSRLIQFSVGAVTLGVALLWWGQKT